MPAKVPTLYEWLGGSEVLSRLIERFYEKVPSDPLLAPLFASMPKEHFVHVAQFIAEVFWRGLPITRRSTADTRP